VVSEILVPRLDGLALCRRLKGDQGTKHIPVLMLSILAATARARDSGADGFLAKPVSQDRLVAAVTRLLPRRAANEDRQ
jgi:CheY-like chemotaxis protein